MTRGKERRGGGGEKTEDKEEEEGEVALHQLAFQTGFLRRASAY